MVVDLRDEIKRQEANVQALLRDIEEYEERIAKLKKEKVDIEEKCKAKIDKHERSFLRKEHGWKKREKELNDNIQNLIYNLNDPEKANGLPELRDFGSYSIW